MAEPVDPHPTPAPQGEGAINVSFPLKAIAPWVGFLAITGMNAVGMGTSHSTLAGRLDASQQTLAQRLDESLKPLTSRLEGIERELAEQRGAALPSMVKDHEARLRLLEEFRAAHERSPK